MSCGRHVKTAPCCLCSISTYWSLPSSSSLAVPEQLLHCSLAGPEGSGDCQQNLAVDAGAGEELLLRAADLCPLQVQQQLLHFPQHCGPDDESSRAQWCPSLEATQRTVWPPPGCSAAVRCLLSQAAWSLQPQATAQWECRADGEGLRGTG